MSKYSIKQKNEAVQLALQAPSLVSVAEELNIPKSTLHDWVREHRLLNKENFSPNKIDIKNELAKKDKEIKKLKEELEILKKFEAFSAKMCDKNTHS